MSIEKSEDEPPKQRWTSKQIAITVFVVFAIAWLFIFFKELLVTLPTSGNPKALGPIATVGVWRANNVMAYVALLHFFVAGGAVWLIALNLRETKAILREAEDTTAAADRTARAAERAERAFLYPEFLTIPGVSTQREVVSAGAAGWRSNLFILPSITNLGKTAALDVSTSIYSKLTFTELDPRSGLYSRHTTPANSVIKTNGSLRQERIQVLGLSNINDDDQLKICEITIEISFTDLFGQERFIRTITDVILNIARTGVVMGGNDYAGVRTLPDDDQITFDTRITYQK